MPRISWCKGLTNETDERVRKRSKSCEGHIVTEEAKRKISEANSGEKNGMYSKKNRWGHHTKESKMLMSEIHKRLFREGKIKLPKYAFKKGHTPWNNGKKRPEISGEKNNLWKGGLVKIKCEECKKEFEVYPYRKNEVRFCSRHCYDEWRKINLSGENSFNWQGGLSFEPYGPEFNKQLKLLIRERDNFTCQECNYTEEQLGYTFGPHHIDYNKKNSNPNNLILLCRNCNNKANFNREDWTKYFKKRMMDYGTCNKIAS